MQKQRNTFAVPAVEILHLLYFYIGFIVFFVGDRVRPSLVLIGFLSFFSVSALWVVKVLYAGWRIRGRDNSNNTAYMQEIPLLCITFLHQYNNRLDAGINSRYFWIKHRFFRYKPGKGFGNPYQTFIKFLASSIQALYDYNGVKMHHPALQGNKSQKLPEYGVQQERGQEPHLRKHLKAAAIQL